MKVAHVMSTAKDSPQKLKLKPKLLCAKKELSAQNDVKVEKDTVNIVKKKAGSAKKLQQCKQKQTQSDSKVKMDKMDERLSNLSEAKEPSQQLQIGTEKARQKDLKAEKGKQKAATTISYTSSTERR